MTIPSPIPSLSIKSIQTLSPTPPDSIEYMRAFSILIEGTEYSLVEILLETICTAASHKSLSFAGNSNASTPCSRAKAAPFRSTILSIATDIFVPLPRETETRFSKGIIFQSEHLTSIQGIIPIKEIASS